MPNDWDINLAGQQGITGPVGPASIPEAPSNGNLYGRVNGGWATTGTFGGSITINSATDADLVLNKPASGRINLVAGETNGSLRWGLFLGDSAAESGGNAGSNFYIVRYGDNGAAVDTPLQIIRSSGLVYVSPSANDPFRVQVPNGYAARLWSTVAGTRTWGMGTNADGSFWIWDQTGNYAPIQCQPGAGLVGLYGSQVNCYVGGSTVEIANLGIRYDFLSPYNNMIAFAWQSQLAGAVSVYIDNAVVYPVANASDERLKFDIAPSSQPCLDTVLNIPLHEFRWKDHSDPGNPVEDPNAPLVPIGLIAQEVYDVAPYLVVKGNDVEPGSKESRNDVPLAVWNIDRNNMLAVLIGAVQQLSARVAALEARLG
jgi:hypothetical protein